MNHEIYSVRDVKADAHNRPFFVPNRAVALRALTDSILNADNDLAKHPEDYQLYYLGTYDDSTGTINAVPAEHVLNLIDLLGEVKK